MPGRHDWPHVNPYMAARVRERIADRALAADTDWTNGVIVRTRPPRGYRGTHVELTLRLDPSSVLLFYEEGLISLAQDSDMSSVPWSDDDRRRYLLYRGEGPADDWDACVAASDRVDAEAEAAAADWQRGDHSDMFDLSRRDSELGRRVEGFPLYAHMVWGWTPRVQLWDVVHARIPAVFFYAPRSSRT
jgi:hypothetical protein